MHVSLLIGRLMILLATLASSPAGWHGMRISWVKCWPATSSADRTSSNMQRTYGVCLEPQKFPHAIGPLSLVGSHQDHRKFTRFVGTRAPGHQRRWASCRKERDVGGSDRPFSSTRALYVRTYGRAEDRRTARRVARKVWSSGSSMLIQNATLCATCWPGLLGWRRPGLLRARAP